MVSCSVVFRPLFSLKNIPKIFFNAGTSRCSGADAWRFCFGPSPRGMPPLVKITVSQPLPGEPGFSESDIPHLRILTALSPLLFCYLPVWFISSQVPVGPGSVYLCTFEPSIAVDSVDACWMDGEVENGKTSFSSISPRSNPARCFITQVVWVSWLRPELSYFRPPGEVAGLLSRDRDWHFLKQITAATIKMTALTECLLCMGTEIKCFMYIVFFNFPTMYMN